MELSGQKEAAFQVPEITAHAHDIRLDIQQKPQNHLVAPIRHQVLRQDNDIPALPQRDCFQTCGSQGDVFVAVKEIRSLKRKLHQNDLHKADRHVPRKPGPLVQGPCLPAGRKGHSIRGNDLTEKPRPLGRGASLSINCHRGTSLCLEFLLHLCDINHF